MSTETSVMSPEAQRIAIAEACGWTNVRVATILKGRVLKAGIWGNPPSWNAGGYTVGELIPDYLNSLDAMHEAEKLIEDDLKQCEEYGRQLIRIVLDVKTDGVPATYSGVVCVSRATAPQRAEAFLRTLNLWTTQPPTP